MARKNGRPVSIYVDAHTAEQAEAVAAAENRKIGQLGGEALAFWTSLPAAARAAFRFVEGLGTEADQAHARREVTRALLVVQRATASERASQEIRTQFAGLEQLTDQEVEQLSVELSKGPSGTEVGASGSRQSPTRSPDGRSSRRSRSGMS